VKPRDENVTNSNNSFQVSTGIALSSFFFPFPGKKSERHCSHHFIFRMLVAPEINLHLFLRRIKRKTIISSDDNISVMFCRCLFECSETTSSSEATTTSSSSVSGGNKIRSTNERNSKPARDPIRSSYCACLNFTHFYNLYVCSALAAPTRQQQLHCQTRDAAPP
jgi:hypothetical protein